LPVDGGYGLPTRLLGAEGVDGPDPSVSMTVPMALIVFGGGRVDFFSGFAASRFAFVDGSFFAFFFLYSNGQNDFTKGGLIPKFTFDLLSIENGYSHRRPRRCRNTCVFRL
jgi:hypothetical protein